LLARKGVPYEQLPKLLATVGVIDSARAAEGKIQRGTFRCTFFLQLLCALQADLPERIQQLLDARESWEAASRQLFLGELSDHSLTFAALSERLAAESGLTLETSQIEHQVMAGTYPLTLLLQLSLVAPVAGLERFIDASDISKAATEQTVVAS